MDTQFDESTGIYQRWHRQASTTEGMKAIFEAFAHNADHWHGLETIAEWIQHPLSANNPGGHISDPRIRAEYVRDLKEARASYKAVRRLLDNGDYENACIESISLGRIVERIGVRSHEANAARGAKTLASARKGHRVVHGTADDKRSRRAKILRDWKEAQAQHPDWTLVAVDSEVAGINACSPKTVQRARLARES